MDSNTGGPVNPLSNLEDVVAAAQQAATAAQTPKEQFNSQFGSGITPPPAEAPTNTAAVMPDSNPAAEAAKPTEQTPADRLKQEISDDVDAFLEEVVKEKAPV